MIAIFLITLTLGQLLGVSRSLLGMSLTGRYRIAGGFVGGLLFVVGWALLPDNWLLLWWIPPATVITIVCLVFAGSFVAPIPSPETVYLSGNSEYGVAQPVSIADGEYNIPGVLLTSATKNMGHAVCIIHGAGDTKTSFKWLLVRSLLAKGVTILTVDLPGHGDYRHRPLTVSSAVQTVAKATDFLRQQPGVSTVGLVGISLGGAIAAQALCVNPGLADALIIYAMPVSLRYTRRLFFQVVWNTFCCAPIIGLFQDITARQARQTWNRGGYVSQYNTSQLFAQLQPLTKLEELSALPILMVYSRHDAVAPPHQVAIIRERVPHANFLEVTRSSHVTITLLPGVNDHMAHWLVVQNKD
jgi:pimeloyl-ACP methyl ester carboxylesterase